MVHDDDSPRRRNIAPGSEPLSMRAPRNAKISDLIVDTARANPNWGRLRIYEELRSDGHHLDESEVNFVLRQYRLPNLRR